LVHIFSIISCLLFPILYKMTAILVNSLNPRLLFELMHKHRITHLSGVPEMYLLLSRFQDSITEPPSLRTLICGGSALSAEDFHRIRLSAGAELLHGYGLTELAPVSRNMRGQARAGTVGPVCWGIECRIASPDSSGSGEILLRSPYAFKGYLRRPRETAEAFAQGWFQTGDIGRMDGGHLEFCRERKRTCKVNGNLVDLEEVRRALALDPLIREARVERERSGLCARIALRRGSLDRETVLAIKRNLHGLLAEYKIPKTILEENE
jgi:long-chain acyl-CoA synthetase